MSKFTIFTIILSISVITVTADLAMRAYYAAGTDSQASVFSSDESNDAQGDTETDAPAPTPPPAPAQQEEQPTNPAAVPPPPSQSSENPPPPPSSNINQSLITQAGFNGTLAEDHFNGKVFQLLDITKYPVEAISLYKFVDAGVPVATVAEIALRDEITALQLYILLQNKTKPYIDLSLNETNAYGDRSFYINHAKKTDEAFLAVKIGKMIYAFAYVKSYHPQIKNIIQLLGS